MYKNIIDFNLDPSYIHTICINTNAICVRLTTFQKRLNRLLKVVVLVPVLHNIY